MINTWGAELEWTDWDTRIELPGYLGVLDPKEHDVCNLDGTAYHHTHMGGEICMVPTLTASQLAENFATLKSVCNPGVNYRSFTHIHIGGVTLEEAKKILTYSVEIKDFVKYQLSPTPPPGRLDEESVKNWKSYRGKVNSWMYRVVPAVCVEEALKAETIDKLVEAHYPRHKDGKGRTYSVTPRTGVNLRSLRKHGTVEFRFFWGTVDVEEFKECLRFVQDFFDHACGDRAPIEEWCVDFNLPKAIPFNPEHEKTFLKTCSS